MKAKMMQRNLATTDVPPKPNTFEHICHVRFCPISDQAAFSNKELLLTTDEKVKRARFVKKDDQLRFELGRILCKTLVAEQLDVSPSAITIQLECKHCHSTEHGKPYALYDNSSHPISISHSGNYVMVAMTDGPQVGVDIEHCSRSVNFRELLSILASPHENASLPTNPEQFNRLWTHKEAVLKCTGDGLMLSPTNFSVFFDQTRSPIVSPCPGVKLPHIQLRTLQFHQSYSAAIALSTEKEFAVDLRKFIVNN